MTVKRFLAILNTSRDLDDFINRYNAAKAPYHTGSWDNRR